VKLDPADITGELRPVIREVVANVMEELRAADAKVNGRLAYTESEAAALIGVPRHVLRDVRLREHIPVKKVGKTIVWPRDILVSYLHDHPS
jgi:hypothetical protein